MSTSEPLMRCRKEKDDVKTNVSSFTLGLVQEIPVYCLNGVRHIGGMKLIQALVWNVGNCRPDAKGDCAAKLQKRWRTALRNRYAGADSKPPQAAVVKNHGGER